MTTKTSTLPISFEDAIGRKWTRAKIGRTLLQEIQSAEDALEKEFDLKIQETQEATEAAETKESAVNYLVTQNKLFDVRLKVIDGLYGNESGQPLSVDDLDVSEAQHIYQGFWRSVWGLDPKGNLL